MTRIAVVDQQGRVVTFVRRDVPSGWQPPDSCRAVPESALPAGWQMAPPPPSPVPEFVKAVQFRHLLICKGLAAGVDAAIEQVATPVERDMVRSYWEYETEFARTSPRLATLAAACRFTEAQMDDLFREASGIVP